LSNPAALKGSLRSLAAATFLAIVAVALCFFPARPKNPASVDSRAKQIQQSDSYIPLAFEANQGQTDSAVKYLARGNGYTLFLTSQDTVFSLRTRSSESPSSRRESRSSASNPLQNPVPADSTAVVRMHLVGSNSSPQVAASALLPGKSNYFLGNDPGKWRSNVPHYARVFYRDVYPGVTMAFHGAQRQPEFDFVVSPDASPAPIRFNFTGQRSLHTDGSGNLLASSNAGDIVLHKPVAYQEQNGRRQLVDARFLLLANNQVTFKLGNYDHNRELVIDPSVSYAYSTYLGGTGDDAGYGIAFDNFGNSYVTGQTSSADFPGASGTNKLVGTANAFVTKIDANGSGLIYTTYIGGTGSGGDSGNAIAVDQATGAVFVAGGTSSSDFPTTTGAFQTTLGSGALGNAFVLELNSTGGVAYSTFLGGTVDDVALGIALDTSNNVYVVGRTFSADFPTKSPLQSSVSEGFVSKLTPSGGGASDLIFSTYLGGSSDYAGALALDSSANVYITGFTAGVGFHPTSGVFQGTYGGGSGDAFVTEINSTGNAYVYSTFLGGSDIDIGNGIAVDSSGNAYVTGQTSSSNSSTTHFPLQSALQPTYGGGASDAFVAKLNPTGTALLYSTYLGGTLSDVGAHIALDGNNNAYVTGQTFSSSGFKTVNPTQPAFGGSSDAFVSEVNSTGSALVFSTYLGGTGDENTTNTFAGIAVDSPGSFIYVTGNTTSSTGFPTQVPYPYAGGNSYAGGTADAFVTKYAQGPVFSMIATTPNAVSPGSPATSTVTLTSYNGYSSPVNLSCTVAGSGVLGPTCTASSFQPGQVTPAATPGVTSTLTIATAGSSASAIRPGKSLYAMWLPLAGLSLFGIGFQSSPVRRKKLTGLWVLGTLLTFLFLLSACGGSSSGGGGGGGGSTGTPAGNYTVTITGTGTDSNSVTQSSQFILTVN
jgi:Beta-propeller repeat